MLDPQRPERAPHRLPRPAGESRTPELGWTLVVCVADGCRSTLGDLALARLRPVVRASPQAVLVGAQCPLGPGGCATENASAFGRGVTLVVQRCLAADRRPVGEAMVVGPLRTESDLDFVCRWLAMGELDPQVLPERLRRVAAAAKAPLN